MQRRVQLSHEPTHTCISNGDTPNPKCEGASRRVRLRVILASPKATEASPMTQRYSVGKKENQRSTYHTLSCGPHTTVSVESHGGVSTYLATSGFG